MSSVLVVDDESGIRNLLTRWLTSEGYEVRGACDAETALEEMAKATAEVVMCDLDMPGHGGLWLAVQLRERFPDTAIVLATALDSVPPVTSMQPGIVEYLVKPFARHRVIRAVSHGVDWHAAAGTRPADSTAADRLAKWFDAIED